MKKKLFFLFCVVPCFFVNLYAEGKCYTEVLYTAEDGAVKAIFETKTIVWAGMDLRKLTCVGARDDFVDKKSCESNGDIDVAKIIQTVSFRRWNETFFEPGIVRIIKEAVGRKNVVVDIVEMEKINSEAKNDDLFFLRDIEKNLTVEQVKEMVKSYDTEEKNGVGAAVIVKKFSKIHEKAEMILVFFDLNSKKLLFAAQVSAKTQGIGVYNHWFGAIKYMLKDLRSSSWNEWSKKYNK